MRWASFIYYLLFFDSAFHSFQTGWGTRAGIGDAAAATAALERQNNEKDTRNNNPYQPQSHLEQPLYPAVTPLHSPNDLPPSPYRDDPASVYGSGPTPRNRSLNRPTDEESGVGTQFAIAR